MDTASFDRLVTLISGDQPPRVWSLLVTVFGELAQDDEARVSGAMLGRLTRLIGIKPEAMRVALHRLRKDGWIESLRTGRQSAYFLTDWGRTQSAEASPRIYATGPPASAAWLLLVDPASAVPKERLDAKWISSSVCIARNNPGADQTLAIALNAESALPVWMRHKLCEPALAGQSTVFANRLAELEGALEEAGTLAPLQVAVLRVLVVHGWRRIVLRAPLLPDFVFPADWQGPECRQAVSRLLERLPDQTLAELEDAAAA